MRLLFVIHSLKMGGAERVLSIMANHFSRAGYEVYIAAFDGDGGFYDIDENIRVFNLSLASPSFSLSSAIYSNIKRIIAVRSRIKETKPDLVISFLTHTNIVSILAAKSLGVSVIACEHSNYGFLKSSLWQKIRGFVYPFANVVTTLTVEDAKNYPSLKNIEILPNPLLPPKKEPARRENLIIGVGRLSYEKGFDRLIEAFCTSDTKGWKLIIVGDGTQKKELLEQIEGCPKKSDIALAGARKDVEFFYSMASIFVLSSREEGFPMALCEAMSYGVAPIAFDCKTGPLEIITDGVDGVLVKEGDTSALADAIYDLATDKEKRERLANEATKIIDKLSVEKIAAKWEDIFAKLEK